MVLFVIIVIGRLKYTTPELDWVIKERERLFLGPLTCIQIKEAKNKEMVSQKLDDLFRGIENLKKRS